MQTHTDKLSSFPVLLEVLLGLQHVFQGGAVTAEPRHYMQYQGFACSTINFTWKLPRDHETPWNHDTFSKHGTAIWHLPVLVRIGTVCTHKHSSTPAS